jgi:ABC-type lipoprotein release transport system permease subunit
MNDATNIYRANTKKSGRSYIRTLFLLTANLFLLYLFIDLRFILYAVGLFGGMLLIVVLIKFVKAYRKMGSIRSKSINSDIFKVSFKYLNMNKIYVVATVIGLVLATVVASQAVLVSSSYQKQVFDDYIINNNDRALEFRLDSFNNIEILEDWIDYFEGIDEIIEENELTLNYTKTTMQLINEIILGEPEEYSDGLYQPTFRVQVLEYTEEIFNLYSSFPSFDSTNEYNPSGSLLIVPNYYAYNESLLVNNETIDILTDSAYKQNTNDSFNTIPLHNVNYFTATDEDDEYFWESNNYILYANQFYPFREYLFLNQSAIDQLMFDIWDILSEIEPGMENWFWFDVSAISSVYVELPEITSSNIDTLISKLSRLENDARDFSSTFERSNNLWIWTYSPLYHSLENYMFEVAGFNTIILLVTGPLIALALFLVYFSLTLVEQRKQRVIAILKVRGSSKDQLHTMMLSEALIAALIAVIVGMILSIPWTLLSLRASGILQFNNPAIPINIPANWFWRLPLIGIVFSLNLNISSISSLSSTTIDEGEVTEEKKTPFWQRMYLDLILVSISVIFWISIQFIPGDLVFLKSILVIAIGPFTMIIFLIGIPLVTARYFSSIIGKISDILWKNFSGMVALATRNMRKNKFSASRLVSFLLLGMMLSYVSVIIPTTFIDWNAEDTAYSMGSEIYISGLDSSNATQLGFLDIPEIDAYSEIVKISFQSGSYDRIGSYNILGIDPTTFEDAAFWRDNYDDKSLSAILDKIDNNSSIGMQTQTMIAMGVEIDDYVSIEVFGSEKKFEFNITTNYEFFPNLVRSLPYMEDNGGYFANRYYGLITLDMAKSMSNHTPGYKIGTYVNVKDSANATALAISLRESFSSNSDIEVRSVDEYTGHLMEDPIVILLLSSLQGMTIITVIASIMAVSYFSFISLSERKREIGVFRALGMVRKQIFILLVAEGIVILSMGIFVGGIAGYAIVYIFFQFLSELFGQGGNNGVPPLRIITPWAIVGIFTLIMFVLTLAAAAAPAQYTAKQQTGSILRAE